jgi:hypothetical protein
MNKANGPVVKRIRIALGLVLLIALAGCLGYVDGGYGGAVVVPEPDLYLFGGGYYGGGYYGGGYERGRDVHAYSHRGAASRAVAHSGRGGHGRNR